MRWEGGVGGGEGKKTNSMFSKRFKLFPTFLEHIF